MRVAGRESAEAVLGTARQLVPVKEGTLRDSGEVVEIESDDRAAFAVQFKEPTAHLVEFGTAERTMKSGKSTGAARKKPFLFPAFRINRTRIKSRFSRAINKSVKQVAGK